MKSERLEQRRAHICEQIGTDLIWKRRDVQIELGAYQYLKKTNRIREWEIGLGMQR